MKVIFAIGGFNGVVWESLIVLQRVLIRCQARGTRVQARLPQPKTEWKIKLAVAAGEELERVNVRRLRRGCVCLCLARRHEKEARAFCMSEFGLRVLFVASSCG